MDLKTLVNLKQSGKAQLQRLGPDTYQFIVKKFDQHTGKELPPEIMPANLKGLEQALESAKAALKEQEMAISTLQAAVDEMNQTEEAAKVK